jgi:multidrug efflux pump subunit AcrA (membrane-fusion protein)
MNQAIRRSESPSRTGGRCRWGAVSRGLIVAAAGLGLAAVHSATPPSRSPGGTPALPVAALQVFPQQGYQRARSFVGRVEAARESRVGFEFGGLLSVVLVEEGDRVEADAIVARLNTERIEAQRAELEAARAEAEARLAREQHHVAQAGLRLARARLDSIQVDLAKSTLRAPYPAVVTRRHVDEGRVVAAGEPIVDQQELAVPEVRIGVAGPLIEALAQGQRYEFQVHGQLLAARAKAILPLQDAGTRTVDVVFTLEEP